VNRDEVHLWWTPLDRDPGAPADLRSRKKHASAVGDTLVRRVLSQYAAVAPEDWSFAAGEHGRPRAIGHAGDALGDLDFNLSHDSALALVGVARGTVGVDVEAITTPAPLEVAEFFAPSEARALASLPPAEQPRRFFETWVLKEAYAKARGLGLRLALDGFAFEFGDGAPRLSCAGDDPARWWFALVEPAPGHVAAVAWRDPPPEPRLVVRRFDLPDQPSASSGLVVSTSGRSSSST